MSSSKSQCQYPGCERDFDTLRGMKNHHAKTHDAVVIEYTKCEFCEDLLIDDPRAAGDKYCSEPCAKSHFSEKRTCEKAEVTCKDCGETHLVYPYRAKERFSDGKMENCVSCMDKKVEVDCEWCGTPTTIHNYRVSEESNHFCSMECQGDWRSKLFEGENHPRWKGGYRDIPFSNNWKTKREERLKMDNEQCLNCGLSREESLSKTGRDLHVHHKTSRMEYYKDDTKTMAESNAVSNLATLCSSCHRKLETDKIEVDF